MPGCILLLSKRSRVVVILVEINHLALLGLHGAQWLDEALPLMLRLLLLQRSVELVYVLVVRAILRIGEVVRVPRRREALGDRRGAAWAVLSA